MESNDRRDESSQKAFACQPAVFTLQPKTKIKQVSKACKKSIF